MEERIAAERAAILEDTDELLAKAALTLGVLHDTDTDALDRPHA